MKETITLNKSWHKSNKLQQPKTKLKRKRIIQ